jgi:thioredoxin reductase
MIKRRQFLFGALGSTCALTCKKLAAFAGPDAVSVSNNPVHAATAQEKASAAAVMAAGNSCPYLLSPLKIRDRVLKNRIMYCVAGLYTFQGPENYPSEAWRNHHATVAKNAAIITYPTSFGKYPKTYHTKAEDPDMWSWEHISSNKWEDIPPTWNYIERSFDDFHSVGTLIVSGGNSGDVGDTPVAGDVSGEGSAKSVLAGGGPGGPGGPGGGRGPGGGPGGGSKSIEDIVKDAKDKESLGYDLYNVGSVEEAKAVRNATNLLLIAPYNGIAAGGSGSMDSGYASMGISPKPTASQIEAAVEAARKLEGLADIFFMKSGGSAGGSWEAGKYEEGPSYYFAQAIKKAGVKIHTCIGFGLYNPVKNDEYIAKGITDMVGMTRPLIADGELITKISAGRVDDIVPCTQCMYCHAESMTNGPHIPRCMVNPQWGTPPYMLEAIKAPLTKKKVAVIGGGPAGLKAALVAAERGHKVTLYEKDAELGGLQKITDYSTWIWTYKVYKDYLIKQVKKAGIEVKLNTRATKEMIKAGGYNTVLVAVGAEPAKSTMKGADAGNVFDIVSCYTNKKALGTNVVMVGSGKLGTEAAVSMALDGHKVTVLAGDAMIGKEDIAAHNVTPQTKIYMTHPNFKHFLNTTVTDITGGKVTYTDKDGEHSIQADSIVFSSVMKPRTEEAASFSGSANDVLLVGDCTGTNGRILKATRSAFFVASKV